MLSSWLELCGLSKRLILLAFFKTYRFEPGVKIPGFFIFVCYTFIMKLENLLNKVFDRLTVLSRGPSNSYGHTRWNCKCSCGNELLVYAADLKLKKMRSCGCLKKELCRAARLKPEGVGALSSLLAQYKNSAKSRNIIFELTADDFKGVVSSNCHYCNRPPSMRVFSEARMKRNSVNGNFTYNGIDRKDSVQGYIVSNVVPCCKTCNFGKNSLAYEEFISHLDNLVSFRAKKLPKV